MRPALERTSPPPAGCNHRAAAGSARTFSLARRRHASAPSPIRLPIPRASLDLASRGFLRCALVATALALTWIAPAHANPGGEHPPSDPHQAAGNPAKPQTPRQKLDEGRDLFRAKEFDHASEKLVSILLPNEQLGLPSDLVEAWLMLGVCYVETGRPGEAKEAFTHVLRLEPTKTLDSLTASQNAIRVFNETKSEVEDERRKLEEQRRIEQLKRAQEEYLKSLRPIEVHQYWVNYLPFGAGQIQEHRIGLGVALATGQGITLATSAGIWLYLVGKYGIVSDRVPPQDVNTVRNLQTIEILSGAAFIGLYGYGVINSLLHYKSRVLVQGDESLLPLELRRKPPKKTSLRERIQILPMATPNGAGVGIGWED
jgi:hypothetical protein